MLAIGVAMLAMGPVSDVSEFFPLDFGRKWVYQDSTGDAAGDVDVVGVEQDIDGHKATPIITKVGKEVAGSTFYRIEDDQVLVVAFEQNRPLAAPYPILKLGSGKTSWQYTGSTQWLGELAPMSIKGSSKRGGSREIMGTKYDTVEVSLDAVIGDPKGMSMKSHQVTVYARGVGLVELTQETTFDKKKREHKRVLVSFSPGKTG